VSSGARVGLVPRDGLVVLLVEAGADLAGVVVAAYALVPGDGGTGGDTSQDPGETEQLPHAQGQRLAAS
jgi:hypothetical protein